MFKEKGFSLVEICCVCGICIALVLLCYVQFCIVRKKAQDSIITQRLTSIPSAILSSENDSSVYGVCSAATIQSIFQDIMVQTNVGITFSTTALPSSSQTMMATCHDSGMYG